MNPTHFNQTTTVIVCLLLGLLVMVWPIGAAAEDEPATQTLGLPQALVDAGLVPVTDTELTQHAAMTWADVQATAEPTPWPAVEPKPFAALSPDGADLLKQAQAALRRGEVFGAVQDLRQAEQTDPGHPRVIRALGLAYAESGNLKRAASYLYRIASAQRGDAEALLVLVRHAAQSESIEQVLAYCLALEKSDVPALLADALRATALHRLGYTTAAMNRLFSAVEAIDQIDLAKLSKEADLPATVLRELRVIKAMLPQLRIELGDFYLQSRDYDRAAKAYAQIQLKDPAEGHLLAARRVYLAMLTGDRDKAVDQVVSLLSASEVTDADAALVDYLVEQGVAAGDLAKRIDALIAADGVNLARLLALSRVAEKGAVLGHLGAWLGRGPLTPQRLERAVSLVRLDDSDPADSKPLADLLLLIAQRLAQTPDEALVHARAAVGAIDAPVTLLRAIQRESFTTDPSDTRRLVAAVTYEATGRQRDAQKAFYELLSADDALAKQVLIPVVRLQLALGFGQESLALIGEPDLDADWPVFELSLRAMAAAGKSREGLTEIDRYIKVHGKQFQSDVLRIELIAQMGQPQEACNLLLRLISSNPDEESLYHLGIDLAYDYRASFSRMTDAERMRRAFLTRLISNLPDSSLARIGMAQNIRSNPARLDEAKALLLKVLKQEPDNRAALSLLVELYDEAGDEASATAMHERYAQVVGPGLPRALLVAERAVSRGQMARAKAVLDRVLELDEQGVLPGPAMTGDQASVLLRHFEAADPKRDLDALYLAMVVRFPDHAGLNNALGYRWAVQDRHLRQAEAMIQRALKQEPTNHSLLDSLAWVQYKLGAFEKAYTTQSRALMVLDAQLARFHGLERELGATIAILNDHMGDILYKLDDPNKALKHWREAMKQGYTEEDMLFDPELRSLEGRLKAKVDALAAQRPVPVAEIPGPDAHGPAGHPADVRPVDPAPGE